MVRGISKQVIVVEGSKQDIFENAIFILKSNCVDEGINEKELLRQAKNALTDGHNLKRHTAFGNALWAFGGFTISCGIWLLAVLL